MAVKIYFWLWCRLVLYVITNSNREDEVDTFFRNIVKIQKTFI